MISLEQFIYYFSLTCICLGLTLMRMGEFNIGLTFIFVIITSILIVIGSNVASKDYGGKER